MEWPLVSVIVRTKDRPELLRDALKSIASQTYRPIEIVLVNDGGCEVDQGEAESDLGRNTVKLCQERNKFGSGSGFKYRIGEE